MLDATLAAALAASVAVAGGLAAGSHAICAPGLHGISAAGSHWISAAGSPAGAAAAERANSADGREVDFSRDVRPILSNHCFACHGPDESARKAGLRLDTPEGLRAKLPSGAHAVVPGDLEASELAYRIGTDLAADRMPPASYEKPLSVVEIETLERWIEQGGTWRRHWAFEPPVRPPVPGTTEEDGASPIDRFVAAKLAAVGLARSPEADRATLLRRVSLDLTGLPPTLAELDRFLADPAPDAYEREVDRLLASPRYGEHMARGWLDAARYGDTHGLHLDNVRSMWPYRDWVVRAFNANLPYDRFTIEQLAGDLLPAPTREQLVASGFNRCNPTSAEGGMIAEEYLALYAKDRTDTTAAVWMGLTMNCAQCHDHKFDPLSQREYYRLFAFFNSLDEEASDRNVENPAPFIRVPSAADEAHMAAIRSDLAEHDARLAAPQPELEAREAAWSASRGAELARRWLAWSPESATATEGATLAVASDLSVVASGANPAQNRYELRGFVPSGRIERLRLEVLAGDDPTGLPGRAFNRNFVLSELEVEIAPRGTDAFARVEWSEAVASWSQEGWPISAAIDGDLMTGWGGLGRRGDRRAELTPRAPFGFDGGTELLVRLRFESVHVSHSLERFRIALDHTGGDGVRFGAWHRAFFADSQTRTARERETPVEASLVALDFAREAAPGVPWTPEPDWRDGEVQRFEPAVGSMVLARKVISDRPRRLALTLGSDDSVQVWVNGRLVHDNPIARSLAPDSDRVDVDLRAGENELVVEVSNHAGDFAFQLRAARALPFEEAPDLALALSAPPEERTQPLEDVVRRAFRATRAPEWIELVDARAARAKQLADYEAALPSTLVSKELATRRPAHVLVRGAYDKLGEAVTPGVPAVLPPLPESSSADRAALARWLVDERHPLTSRVAVNRAWQHFFGRGIVATPEDFGAQGAYPTHPELLDWLAVEFVESGWDVKALHRAIVVSKTYRQSSDCGDLGRAVDPRNDWLSRAPRVRLAGEVLRDQALALAGILDETMGGPGVRPYQPEGIWEAVGYTSSNTAKYERGPLAHLHRRSLYTFWKRTAPPPTLTLFDAPSREACTIARERTNTPLQALAAMNDPTYFEAARFLAHRTLEETASGAGDAPDRARLARLFRAATCRIPKESELDVLERALGEWRAALADDAARAREILSTGELPTPEGTDPVELALWTLAANAVLNLDEVIVRN